jgi:hypothetical protein
MTAAQEFEAANAKYVRLSTRETYSFLPNGNVIIIMFRELR